MHRIAAIVCAVVTGSCFAPRYLAQAGYGQVELLSKSRPIGDVLSDPDTDDYTRAMLGEVDGIKQFAHSVGLKTRGNYKKFVALDRSAAVYFVAASRPLAFEPKVWCWPIVGCFPMLGWFDLAEAESFRHNLIADGWEVYLRGAGAYSTAGWFHDPVVSSMFTDGDNAYGDLANVLLHELMHANVLVPDQAYFDESLAAFTADSMTTEWLVQRFGADSQPMAVYQQEMDDLRAYGDRMWKAYRELEKVYGSDRPDAEKLAAKKKIIDALAADFPEMRRPNNASLIGFRTYRTGFDDFQKLYQACGKSWPRYLDAVRSISPGKFPQPLAEDFGPVLGPLIANGCTPYK